VNNKISSSLPFGLQNSPALQKKPGIDSYNFQQTTSLTESATIYLKTAEGDTVSLSSSSSFMSVFQKMNSVEQNCSTNQTSLAQMSSESLTCSVQGDLNEEELADIKNLIADLADIASSFFSGDSQSAMAKALTMDSMGSIVGLDASFNQTATMATQMTSFHPIPTFSEDIQGTFADLYQNGRPEAKETEDYQGQLFGRWHQIMSLLENITPSDATPVKNQERGSADRVAEEMMNRMEDYLQKNPRMSPFAEPLANRALTRAVSMLPDHPSQATTNSFQQLQSRFKNELQAWLRNTDYTREELISI